MSLTKEERCGLMGIDCYVEEESDLSKGLTLMGFIYGLVAYFIIKGLNG